MCTSILRNVIYVISKIWVIKLIDWLIDSCVIILNQQTELSLVNISDELIGKMHQYCDIMKHYYVKDVSNPSHGDRMFRVNLCITKLNK